MNQPRVPECQHEAPNNIVHMPWQRSAAAMRARTHGRQTVRFVRPARQMPLPLPADTQIERDIQAAKTTAGNLHEWAEAARTNGEKDMAARREALACKWDARVEALITQRARMQTQGELIPDGGATHV